MLSYFTTPSYILDIYCPVINYREYKNYRPAGKRNQGRQLKRLLDV